MYTVNCLAKLAALPFPFFNNLLAPCYAFCNSYLVDILFVSSPRLFFFSNFLRSPFPLRAGQTSAGVKRQLHAVQLQTPLPQFVPSRKVDPVSELHGRKSIAAQHHNPGGGRFGRIVGGERGGVGRLGTAFLLIAELTSDRDPQARASHIPTQWIRPTAVPA